MVSNYLISNKETFFDTIEKEKDQEQLRKFQLLIYAYYKGNSYYKNYWLPELIKELETINRKKRRMIPILWLKFILLSRKNLTETKFETLCKKESILTLEILKIGFIEIEFFCNLILSLNMKTVKLMKGRILNGNFDDTRLKYRDFINSKELLKWSKKIYNLNLLDEYNLNEKEIKLISEIYKYEQEFIEDFFSIIPQYRKFTQTIRNVMSHTHSVLFHREALLIDHIKYFETQGLLAFIYKDIGKTDVFEKTRTGYFLTSKIAWFISGIMRIQEILLGQILWYCGQKVKLIHALVSDEGSKRKEDYHKIWKRLGFWNRSIGPSGLKEEEFGLDKPIDKDSRFLQQQNLLEEIDRLMKKYPNNSNNIM